MKRLIFIFPLILMLFLAQIFLSHLNNSPSSSHTDFQPRPIPEFSLPDLFDPEKQVSTQEIMKSPVAFINFFASWCTSCLIEHETLKDFSKKYPFPIYGINYKDRSREDGLKWLKKYGNPYEKIAFDQNGKMGIEFGLYGVPETFIVHDKKIIFRYSGPITPSVLSDILIPFLKKKKFIPSS